MVIGGDTDPWDWDAWEDERLAINHDNERLLNATAQRRDIAKIPCLIDEIDNLEVRAYLWEQCARAALDVLADVRQRLEFERGLLEDVLRERGVT